MHLNTSRNRLVICLVSLALLVVGTSTASAGPAWTGFVFDVTVDYTPGGEYTYKYDLNIAEDLSSPIDAFWLDGAYGVNLATINHTDTVKYTWLDGEIVMPGEKPSWDVTPVTPGVYKYENTGSDPAIVWGRSSEGTDPKTPGLAGEFVFESSQPPHAREWYVSGCGGEGDSGITTGPSPEPAPILLLLSQGVPILGWIGYRRRRKS